MEPVDFAIITALPEELKAVLSKLESYQPISTASDTLPFYQANLGEAQIAVTRSGAGNIDATHAATTVLKQFKPRYVLMVGIAAGFPGKVNLGDVVVATACYYDGAGKENCNVCNSFKIFRKCSWLVERGRISRYQSSTW